MARRLGQSVCTAVLGLLVSAAAAHPLSGTDIDRYLRANGFSGSVLVARGHQILLARGYGYADLARRLRNTARTGYRVTWLAGQFTDIAILQLADARKLTLGDSICSAISDCPASWRPVTLEDLETYKARFTLPSRHPAASAPLAQWLDSMKGLRPIWSPTGDRRGSTLIQEYIVEATAGTSWWSYVSAHILRRAHMSETGYDGDARTALRATPYDRTRAIRVRDAAATPDRSDGIVSTVTDFLRYSRALDDGTLLSDSSRKWLGELVPGSFVRGAYGVWRYGWLVTRWFGHRFEGEHAHGEPGWSTTLIRLPDDSITVLLFQNRTNGSGDEAIGLVRSLLDCPADARPTPKPC